MTLAERLGIADQRWYTPAVLILGSFALGVQLSLVLQSLGADPYPPLGKEGLAWGSLAVLAVIVVLQSPPSQATLAPVRDGWDKVKQALNASRSVLVLEPLDRGKVKENGQGDGPDEPAVQQAPAERLKVRIHSPLSLGPVAAPDEAIPIHVQAEPEHLARQLEVTFSVEEGGTERSTTLLMTGTDLMHTETFTQPGPFRVVIRARHPEAQAAVKELVGRVATYREEVGRLFDHVRDQARKAGYKVGPQSTPREVCKGMPSFASASYEDAEALRTHLEVALYGDGEVDRSTYEAIHTLLREVGLADEEEVTH